MESFGSFTNNQLSNNQGFNHTQGFVPLNGQVLPTTQPLTKKNRHGKHLDPNYHKKYYLKNKDKIKEKAKNYSKEHYIPVLKEYKSVFKQNQLRKFVGTFGLNKRAVLERLSKEKGAREVWKGIYGKFDAFQILKEDKNYILRLGIKNSYRDFYIGVFDIDGRGWTKIATLNNTTYVKSGGGGIHIFFLFKKKLGHNVKLELPASSKRQAVKVDFKVNGFVIGVGSQHEKTGKRYELKGRGWNFYLGIFDSDVEALNWFVNNYQAQILSKKTKEEINKIIKQEQYEAKVEVPIKHFSEYSKLWWSKKV